MAESRLAKKIDKLEQDADKLRKKAEKRGKDLTSKASSRRQELESEDEKGGKKGMMTLLLAAGAGVAYAMKRKRDQELDEALWEEPRSL